MRQRLTRPGTICLEQYKRDSSWRCVSKTPAKRKRPDTCYTVRTPTRGTARDVAKAARFGQPQSPSPYLLMVCDCPKKRALGIVWGFVDETRGRVSAIARVPYIWLSELAAAATEARRMRRRGRRRQDFKLFWLLCFFSSSEDVSGARVKESPREVKPREDVCKDTDARA